MYNYTFYFLQQNVFKIFLVNSKNKNNVNVYLDVFSNHWTYLGIVIFFFIYTIFKQKKIFTSQCLYWIIVKRILL